MTPLRCLTIGGSDSGGAAGVQADLKTWTALGVYGMSALTVVTAQNSQTVAAVHTLPPTLLRAQIAAVLDDYGADGIKTGFIGRIDLIEAVAVALAAARGARVIDPVLVNHRGAPLFDAAVTAAYRQHLLPLADVVTPSRREAELLAGRAIVTLDDADDAARALCVEYGCRAVLIKGWPHGGVMIDTLYDGDAFWHLAQPHLTTANTHGAGDTLSAALVAHLARGVALPASARAAQTFTHAALVRAAGWQLGGGHGPLAHFTLPPTT